MAVFLTVHARYKDVQWGIFRDDLLLEVVSDESKKISKNLIPLLDDLLSRNKLSLSELSFIAAHQGPAPFTTLRVCLASVNGFSFATGLPLIGVNGLEALVEDYKSDTTTTAVLLNAFCQELYYGITDPFTNSVSYGTAPAERFIEEFSQRPISEVSFLGNGSTLYEDQIKKAFGHRANFVGEELISLESIGRKALEKWSKQDIQKQLMPVYLKGYSSPMAHSVAFETSRRS